MKQTSDAQNNELLNLLRENVASKSIDEESPAENTSSAGMTSEQLLTQLKMQMGGVSATNSDIVEDDYDISGFEIEEHETPQMIQMQYFNNRSDMAAFENINFILAYKESVL